MRYSSSIPSFPSFEDSKPYWVLQSLWCETPTLIDLHAGKDAADEDVGGEEADGSGEAEEGVGDDKHVAEVHDHGDPLGDVQLGVEVEQGVQEQVGC